MKLKQKLLALAVLGVAAAAPAQAAITNSQGGNGELFFSLWHDNGTPNIATDDVSYTRDLNDVFNNWASPTTYALDPSKTAVGTVITYAADALLTSFLAAVPSGADLRWNVAAVDSSGTDRVLSTIRVFPSPLPILTNFRTWASGTDQYLAAVNAKLNAVPGSNSTTATSGEGNAYAGGTAWNDDFGNRATGGFKNDGIGFGSLPFYLFYETVASGSTTTPVSYSQFANGALPGLWTFSSDGTLTYSLVPEADTWAMFAAGLLAIGAIARRRLQA